jgi:predicted phage baseplate assembly protein
MISPESCEDERRRPIIRASAALTGIDDVDVKDDGRGPHVGRKKATLIVTFMNKVRPAISQGNVRLDGGRRPGSRAEVVAIRALPGEDDEADRLEVDIRSESGFDLSDYSLALVESDPRGRPGGTPLKGLDPRYASGSFSFAVECPSDEDCINHSTCPPEPLDEPELSYLNKDYQGFRQLALDRLSLVVPDWTERHAADLGVTIVELFAYVGDHLSYRQDAVATEAYLDTSRKRISVRRHARLVDYHLHEGCNARAWVALTLDQDILDFHPGDVSFRTGRDAKLATPAATIFEAVSTRVTPLRRAHNRLLFYAWDDRECCLRKGATSATFRADPDLPRDPAYPNDPPKLELIAGQILIFEEVKGPKTGIEADADRSHRHVVRLIRVMADEDPLQDPPLPIVHVEWAEADRLPFTLCISSLGRNCEAVTDVTVAWGNVLLVDHGETITENVPAPNMPDPTIVCEHEGQSRKVAGDPIPFRPSLKLGPLAHRQPFPSRSTVARSQGSALAEIPARAEAEARASLERMRASLLAGRASFSQNDVSTLERLLGASSLRESGLAAFLDEGIKKPAGLAATATELSAVKKLLADLRVLLAPKAARVATLQEHLRSGGLLEDDEVCEIAALFGEAYADGLDPEDPRRAGPAAAATVQDPRAAAPVAVMFQTRMTELAKLVGFASLVPGRALRSALQKRVLDGIHDGIRTFLEILAAEAEAHHEPLDREDLNRLRDLFGQDVMDHFPGGSTADHRGKHESAKHQADALRAMVTQLDRLIDRKFAKIDSLSQRVNAGGVLSDDEEAAVTAMIGSAFPDGLAWPRDNAGTAWYPQPDLLKSGADDRVFVVEVDDRGLPHLRFGDGDLGAAPLPGVPFVARYRRGGGLAGNVAAESIAQVISRAAGAPANSTPAGIASVRNPLAASGGVDPELLTEAKRTAPGAFRSQLARAVTADDYASVAGRDPRLQRAAAALRWTGTEFEVQVALDPLAGETASDDVRDDILTDLEMFRRIAHDVRVVAPRFVPLDIVLDVCVDPKFQRGDVEQTLALLFSSRVGRDGRRGLFHPDNLTFGQGIESSRLVAEAMRAAGVLHADVTRLARLGVPGEGRKGQPFLTIGPLEIARVDNDPDFPENGRVTLNLRGGR